MREGSAAAPHAAAPLLAAKKALRARILAARDALDATQRTEDARAIASRIAALPSFDGAVTVLATLPFGSEWDVRPLAQAALDRGKSIVLPRVDKAARMLVLHRVTDLDADVVAGFRGVPEPAPHTAAVRPDERGELYFVATGLPDGSHEFSRTLAEHDAAVRRYLVRYRQRNSGR